MQNFQEDDHSTRLGSHDADVTKTVETNAKTFLKEMLKLAFLGKVNYDNN